MTGMVFSCRDKTKVLVRQRTECCNYLNLLSCHNLMGAQLQHFKNEAFIIGKKARFQQAPTINRSDLVSSLKEALKGTGQKISVNYFKC